MPFEKSLIMKLCRQVLNSEEHKIQLERMNLMHIHEFQEMIRRLYFHIDVERGVRGTYDWLSDELEELGETLKEKKNATTLTRLAA